MDLVFFEALEQRLEIKVVAPVAEVRADDNKSALVEEQVLQNFAIARHHLVWNLTNHHRKQSHIFTGVGEYCSDVGQMHLQTVFVLFLLALKLNEQVTLRLQ